MIADPDSLVQAEVNERFRIENKDMLKLIEIKSFVDRRLSLWRNRKAICNTQPGKEKCQAIIDELEDIRKEICGNEN